MGMRSLSCPPTAGADVVLTKAPLSLAEVLGRVSGPDRGGISFFAGVVRDEEEGRPILSITYEAYESMAQKEIEKILRQAQKRWPVRAAAHHRIGVVPVNESSLLVACAGVHRPEAFAACQWIVDAVKNEAPVWKVAYQWV